MYYQMKSETNQLIIFLILVPLVCPFFFFLLRKTFIQQGHIKLVKSDSEHI